MMFMQVVPTATAMATCDHARAMVSTSDEKRGGDEFVGSLLVSGSSTATATLVDASAASREATEAAHMKRRTPLNTLLPRFIRMYLRHDTGHGWQ